MSTSEILPATCRSNFTKYSRRATEETQGRKQKLKRRERRKPGEGRSNTGEKSRRNTHRNEAARSWTFKELNGKASRGRRGRETRPPTGELQRQRMRRTRKGERRATEDAAGRRTTPVDTLRRLLQQEREEEGVEEEDEEKLVTIKKERPGDAAGQRRQRERKCQLTWVCLHEGWNAFLNPVSDSQAKQASLKH
uniref:Uncharacterized protein n=1 Tax=Toxoplasma gondii TgCATBr9 TaxID=943120 RepID=A0A2T6J1N5_TOXGO|nr:hypothetical protein TGBR9_380980 [Toxoplasma gondii TgCATBr9]